MASASHDADSSGSPPPPLAERGSCVQRRSGGIPCAAWFAQCSQAAVTAIGAELWLRGTGAKLHDRLRDLGDRILSPHSAATVEHGTVREGEGLTLCLLPARPRGRDEASGLFVCLQLT
ncbi:UNVERIFIED_CONTAM: hypothetical protein K2H54_012923 [Gekko kuhli]